MLRKLWLGAAMTGLMASSPAASAATSPKALEAEIVRLSQAAGGVVGVAAWRLDGEGPRLLVHGDERFPMASTFKVAVAGAVLAEVDAGRLELDRMIAVNPADYVASDIIAERFIHPGVSLSVHNLLELMLTQSDNTATDVLVRAAGGPEAVTSWVRKQGVADQRIDRDTAGILREFFGLPEGAFNDALQEALKRDPNLLEKGDRPDPAFDDDVRDTSTPAAMVQLLTRIFSGKALSPDSTQVLMSIMERCRTGDARLKGRLPPGIVVANKTGTIGGSVNDVGVIALPEDRGKIVIAVFIKKSAAPMEERERAIAEIARAVYDYYLFAER